MNLKFTIIIFVIAFIGVFWFFKPDENTIKSQEKFFKIKDTSLISKIIIDNKGNDIIIEKNKYNKWIINSEHNGRDEVIERLVDIMYKFEINSKLSDDDKIIFSKEIKSNYINIKLCNRKKIYLSYNISEIKINNKNINIITSDSFEEYYVFKSSGYPFSIYSVLNTKANFLRDKTIIDIPPVDISQIVSTNHSKPNHSFVLTNKGSRKYELKNSIDLQTNTKPKLTAVERYLSYFQNIKFKEEVIVKERNDSILGSAPEITILIRLNADSLISLSYYKKPIPVKKNILGKEINIDPNNCYLVLNNKAPALIANITEIEGIMKNYDYFTSP